MTMMLLGKQMFACGLMFSNNCYLYNIDSAVWSLYSTSSKLSNGHGLVHQGKIYLPDEINPEVIDPITENRNSWATKATATRFSCYASWKNYIFKFGGLGPDFRDVKRYDPATNSWSNEDTTAPYSIYYSGCATLPNDNILIVGSGLWGDDYRAYTEYNVSSNTWSSIVYGKIDQSSSVVVILGSRVFTIPSSGPLGLIEEYIYSNRTINTSASRFPVSRNYYSSSTAVPAKWFSHLPGGCSGIL